MGEAILIFIALILIVETIGSLIAGIFCSILRRNWIYALVGFVLIFIPDGGLGTLTMLYVAGFWDT